MAFAVLFPAALFPAAAAPAQNVAYSENDGEPWNVIWIVPNSWVGVVIQAPADATWTALQVPLACTSSYGGAANLELGVFAVDPLSGVPGSLLAAGSVTISGRYVLGNYAVRLGNCVLVRAGVRYCIAAHVPPMLPRTAGLVVTDVAPPVVRTFWRNSGTGWSILQSTPWEPRPGMVFRIYADSHAGTAVEYGVGKWGTQGLPRLRALGFANTGNPLTLHVASTVPAVPVLMLVGNRGSVPHPLAPIHVDPILGSFVGLTTSYSPIMDGYAAFDLKIPASVQLEGLRAAFQALVLDPGASLGVSATNGVEITIGQLPAAGSA